MENVSMFSCSTTYIKRAKFDYEARCILSFCPVPKRPRARPGGVGGSAEARVIEPFPRQEILPCASPHSFGPAIQDGLLINDRTASKRGC